MKTRLILTLLFLVIPTFAFCQNHLEKAQLAEKESDYLSVIQFIELFLNEAPKSTLNEAYLLQFRAYHRLGYDAYQEGKAYQSYFKQAVKSLKQAQFHAETPASRQFTEQEIQQRFEQWMDLGTQRFNSAHYQEALFWFQCCVELIPDSQEAKELEIFTTSELGETDQTLQLISEFEQNGYSSDDVFSIGLQLSARNQLFSDRDIQWSEQVVHSKDSTILETLIFYDSEASAYWIQHNQIAKARYHLQRLIQFTDDEWFKISMAKLYLDANLMNEAQFQLSQIFLPEIEDPRVLDYYHQVWTSISQHTTAAFPINTWKINSKLNWMRPYFEAKNLFLKQDFSAAERLSQKAIDNQVNYAPLLFLRANASYQLALTLSDDTEMSKKIVESLPYYERAYQLDAQLPGLKETLRVLYESMGDTKNASRFQ